MLNQAKTVDGNLKKYNQSRPFADYLIPFIAGKKDVVIADVGSGPYSIIGDYLPGVNLKIHHCDKQDFAYFFRRYKATPYATIERQDMENLTYPDCFFDLVHCSNALDHTKDAYAAVQELIRVCKKGGWVYIACNLDQLDTGHKHFWNAKEDGTFAGRYYQFNLKNFGFKIDFIDSGMERRYSKIIATLQKP